MAVVCGNWSGERGRNGAGMEYSSAAFCCFLELGRTSEASTGQVQNRQMEVVLPTGKLSGELFATGDCGF